MDSLKYNGMYRNQTKLIFYLFNDIHVIGTLLLNPDRTKTFPINIKKLQKEEVCIINLRIEEQIDVVDHFHISTIVYMPPRYMNF